MYRTVHLNAPKLYFQCIILENIPPTVEELEADRAISSSIICSNLRVSRVSETGRVKQGLQFTAGLLQNICFSFLRDRQPMAVLHCQSYQNY